jgi:hypothetical protein
MGLKAMFRELFQAVDGEYERRIRAASQVREYHVGGHGHAGDHDPDHGAAADPAHEGEHHDGDGHPVPSSPADDPHHAGEV